MKTYVATMNYTLDPSCVSTIGPDCVYVGTIIASDMIDAANKLDNFLFVEYDFNITDRFVIVYDNIDYQTVIKIQYPHEDGEMVVYLFEQHIIK